MNYTLLKTAKTVTPTQDGDVAYIWKTTTRTLTITQTEQGFAFCMIWGNPGNLDVLTGSVGDEFSMVELLAWVNAG
jgi:hypothetical protein